MPVPILNRTVAGESGNYDARPTRRGRPRATGWARRFLRFRREGPFARLHTGPSGGAQRDDARRCTSASSTPSATSRRDPDLAGLLITGTGDVFAPGGDMGGGGDDNWLTFGAALGHGRHPVRDTAPVRQTGCVRGQRAVPGRRPADRAVQRHGGRQRPRHLPGARAVPRYRRHVLQPDARAADRPGAHPRPDVHRPHAERCRGRGLGHGRPGRAARRTDGCRP